MNSGPVFIIAEAGVNHNGSLDMAMRLVDVAVDAGADAVKFQTFKAECVISGAARKARYQIDTTGDDETQLQMVKKLELGQREHHLLAEHCRRRRIRFLSTPFDSESLRFLAEAIDVPFIKIPSGEITNGPFLLEIARTGKPVILSTGMSSLGEVERALGVLAFGYTVAEGGPGVEAFHAAYRSLEGREALRTNVTLLHCTTEYPVPFTDINLLAMQTLRAAFGLLVGYSDHSEGIAVPIAAVACGAAVIEKHITLDRSLPGPDHKASLEPKELALMVRSIREVEASMGSPLKTPAPSELDNRNVVRRSIVAARDINMGEYFTAENLDLKRPGTGISPFRYWELVGRTARKRYGQDELLHDEG